VPQVSLGSICPANTLPPCLPPTHLEVPLGPAGPLPEHVADLLGGLWACVGRAGHNTRHEMQHDVYGQDGGPETQQILGNPLTTHPALGMTASISMQMEFF
jgi:hypothetical protein